MYLVNSTCLNCGRPINKEVNYPTLESTVCCSQCGYFYKITKVRSTTNSIEDLGMYKVVMSKTVWGYVKLTDRDNDTIGLAVDLEGFDSFYTWISKNKSDFKSISISHLEGDNIVVNNLLTLIE